MNLYIIIIALVFLSFEIRGQEIKNNKSCDDDRYFLKSRVKQLDEFIRRFNGIIDYKGDAIDTTKIQPDSLKTLRRFTLTSLFNEDYYTKNSEQIDSFLNIVLKTDTVKLNLNRDNWYAEVNCRVKYKNEVFNIDMILQNITFNNIGSKWMIVSVNSNFLSKPLEENEMIIQPMSNEVNFSHLMKYLNYKKTNKSSFFINKENFDNYSAFIFLLNQDLITIKAINSIKYHFLQLANVVIKVEEFNHTGINSGWLISEIIFINNRKKYCKQFLKLY